MTAAAVLAEARAAGLSVRSEAGALRVSPSEGLTPALRERLQAVKPELLELLSVTQVTAAQEWAAAFARLRVCGWPGRAVVARLRPALLRAIDGAEEQAERLSVAFSTGQVDGAPFQASVRRWETLVRAAAAEIRPLCSDCGKVTAVAFVDPLTDERFCRECARPPEES